ncbi:right-handed parallel beta-helix repeat-containing protein [Streptomyces chartreusis]|uniref:right-handed parallel beta-helix repeat-containing protein n=1 Tax=Streptomyces chartreusis TaxID=1969 RepID=UPI0033D903D5
MTTIAPKSHMSGLAAITAGGEDREFMPSKPAAFMSYVRFNDRHDDGLVTQFRERLAAEIKAQTGEEFAIFQDRDNIAWGQNWQQRIDEALDAVTFLLVIITPSLFRSRACRVEVTRFLERERDLGRQDLILPVYYISAPELEDSKRREADEMARALAARQYADWRELRFEPFTSPQVRKTVAQLASRLRDAYLNKPDISSPDPVTVRGTAATRVLPESTEQMAGKAEVTTKSEPPTHVVDPYHRGDFFTVSAAIKSAQPGDRILIRPGLYVEALDIDKPLEIIGDGPVSDIQVRASNDSTLTFNANIGRVENLTIRQTGRYWYGVEISQGRLELEGCEINSRGLACIDIRDGADPRVRRNKIHGSRKSGVYVHDGGLGTLEDNEITGNALSGVRITTDGDPTLRRNYIHENKQNGVYVHNGGLGTLEENEISDNTFPGVVIETGGNPTLRHNRIHDNKESGVYVNDGGLGTLEGNEISGNALSGAGIVSGGNPMLRFNHIHGNKQSGVYVYGRGLGKLEENDINGNAMAGVRITAGSRSTLLANRINENGYEAVWVDKGGGGVIQDNDLTKNARGAWDIAIDCEENLTREHNIE